MKKIMMAVLLGMIFSGCVYQSNQNIKEQAGIENLTGQDLILRICKLPYKQLSGEICPVWPEAGEKDINISAEQSGIYVLSQFTRQVNRGASKGDVAVYFASQIFLTSRDFASVKLCRDDFNPMNVALILISEPCPLGSTAQDAPVDQCENAIPINTDHNP